VPADRTDRRNNLVRVRHPIWYENAIDYYDRFLIALAGEGASIVEFWQ
jgi:hypothetical protein